MVYTPRCTVCNQTLHSNQTRHLLGYMLCPEHHEWLTGELLPTARQLIGKMQKVLDAPSGD